MKEENLTLNNLRDHIHKNAVAKGFYDKQREVGTLLMLCVSELSEALEADRKDWHALWEFYNKGVASPLHDKNKLFKSYIKDSFEDELADTIIRILDLCGHLEIDIEKHIILKMQYNKGREKMHGKNY